MKKQYQEKPASGQRILRLPEVISRCGLRRGSIYSRIKDGDFPSPIRLGANSIGWIESEVDAWLQERIRQSRQS